MNNDSSKGLLAVTISVLVFLFWYSVIMPKFWPNQATKSEGPKPIATQEAPAPQVEPKETVKEENVAETTSKLENKYFVATFTNYGAVPTDWQLKTYTVKTDQSESLVTLVPLKKLPEMPLGISFLKSNFNFPVEPRYKLVEQGENFLRYQWSTSGVILEKKYTIANDDYGVDLDISIKNTGKDPLNEQISLGWTAAIQKNKESGLLSFLKKPADVRMPLYYMNGKVTRDANPSAINQTEVKIGKIYWAGVEDRYFMSVIIPKIASEEYGLKLAKFGSNEDEGFYSGIVLPVASIASQGKQDYAFSIFAGPKDMQVLKKAGMNLDKAIDYGWFTIIAFPILYVLKFLYGIVHNYGIAIILLTILIKILLNPISKKSMKSMKAMQQLQPRLQALKEKYKNDKERLNLETMQLFKTHKVNPMSGCLPMLLQLPVYIALYRVLWNSIELYQAPFFWFYRDLSQPDPYFIFPLLLGVAMFFQQKLTPSATADPMQKKMMMMMPVMFTVFLAFLPVGLVVYILVNTVMSVVQQWMSTNDVTFKDLIRGRLARA